MDKRNGTGSKRRRTGEKGNTKGNAKVRSVKRSTVRYELKASYEKNKRIYTVLDISADRSLDDLCSMILDAFDFSHDHLYFFNFDGRRYGEGENVYHYMPDAGEKGTDIKLRELNLSQKQKFFLLYDFGDEWGFDIQVEKIYETEGHVIDGIISVKGQLEQYPDPDIEDWEEFDPDIFDDDDFDDDLDDEFGDWLEDYLEDMEEEMGILPFRVDPALMVRDVLDTIDEETLRLYASAFLGLEKGPDCLDGKSILEVREQYAHAILQEKDRLLLFLRGKSIDIFRFMMTAKIDPESGVLSLTDLMAQMFFEDEQSAEEFSISLMYLYSLGICMPEMDSEGMVQSFLICREVRDAYENWIKQSRIGTRIVMYEDVERLASVLVCRYGVIEVQTLQKICQRELAYKMKQKDFLWLLKGRLTYFGRFEIYEGRIKNTVYLSAFDMEDTEKVLCAREEYPELTYHTYDMADINDFMSGNPFSDVDCYMELMDSLWKSIRDIQIVGQLIQDITDMCMMETDPETIINEVRTVLNKSGRRMTKKLQELIRGTAGNMPLATRYGYTLAELEK